MTSTTKPLQTALQYFGRGWRVIPVHHPLPDGGCSCGRSDCGKPGKHPCPKAWQKAETPMGEKEIRYWWKRDPSFNIGICTGTLSGGLLYLDIDQHTPSADGRKALADLETRFGPLPSTLTQRTGGGGEGRLFLANPEDLAKIKNRAGAASIAPGLDLRVSGGQFVAPPSLHSSGKRYEWVNPDTPVAMAPEWFVQLCISSCSGQEKPSSPPVSQVRPPSPPKTDPHDPKRNYCIAALERACEAIRAAPPGGRNNTLNDQSYGIGQIVAAGGLDQAEAEEALVNAAEGAGLTRGEAGATVRSGLSSGGKSPRDLSEVGNHSRETPSSSHSAGDDPRSLFNPARATDLGNAERFISLCGKNVRYCKGLGWLIWDGKRWLKDADDKVVELYKTMIPSIYQEAVDARDVNLRQSLARWAISSERQKQISGCLFMARSDRALYVQNADLFDGNKWLLNVQNGTLDLSTGRLREARRDDLNTRLTPIAYDHTAQCPTWKQFLSEIMQGDAEMVAYLQRVIGYTLTGETREQCWFFLHGAGQNGKSTLVGILGKLMGEYGIKTEIETFMASKMDRKAGAPSPDIAAMAGSRYVFASETEEGRRLAVGKIKDMVSGEPVTARQLHKDPFQFTPLWKLWISGNHRPTIPDTTFSTWRRLKLIPFNYRVPDEKKDGSLGDKLTDELPGILKWAVDGCLDWQKHGMREPEAVKTATSNYRNSQDVVAAFIDECCFIPASRPWDVQTSAKDLYHAYTEWAHQSGERSVNQRRFGEALSERGFERFRGGKDGGHRWRGIGMRSLDPFNSTDPSDPSDLKNNNLPYKSCMEEDYLKRGQKGQKGQQNDDDEGEVL